MWAAANRRSRTSGGIELADSWATDGHKWFNVPYDSRLRLLRPPRPQRHGHLLLAPYLARSGRTRAPATWTPNPPAAHVVSRSRPRCAGSGRDGIAAMVDQSCGNARQFAARLAAGRRRVVNDVVLNQVLVAFCADDVHTEAVVRRVQEGGVCWLGGSTWHGQSVMRISVSNWSTTAGDVDRVVATMSRLRSELTA